MHCFVTQQDGHLVSHDIMTSNAEPLHLEVVSSQKPGRYKRFLAAGGGLDGLTSLYVHRASSQAVTAMIANTATMNTPLELEALTCFAFTSHTVHTHTYT